MQELNNLGDYSKNLEDCPDGYGSFKTTYYSKFTCSNTHPSTSVDNNIPVFQITGLPPHFRREVRIEIFHMKESGVVISFKMDGITQPDYTMVKTKDERLQTICDKNSKNDYDPESEYYYNFNYFTTNLPSNNAITLFSVIDKCSGTSYLRIKAIQYNIETCDNSCLSCQNSATNCTSCDNNCSILQGSACVLQNSNYILQEGKCVSACTSPHFNVNGICIWIPNCQALTTGKYCTICKSGFIPVQTDNYEAQCQVSCPNNYEVVNGVCLDQKRNIQGQQLLQGLYSYMFSSYELERIGVILTNFMDVYSSAKYTRCGNYQLLGGYFSNKQNSLIASKQYSTTYQFVRISFKWVLIDYNSTSQPKSVTVTVVNSSTVGQTISITGITPVQICGLSQGEYVGEFLYDYAVPSGKVTLNILNSMPIIATGLDSKDKLNKNQYFGIRELSIFAFNCLQNLCQTCSSPTASNGCTKCIQGYYILNNVCTPCQSECLECSIGTQCTICKGGRILNASYKCVCPSKQYFNGTICVACLNNSCETCDTTDSNICLTCPANFYSYNNTCVSPCPDQNYKNDLLKTCEHCFSQCKVCSNNSSCTTCMPSHYLQPDGKSCQTTCPIGYQANDAQLKCLACEQYCEKCQSDLTQCTKCGNNYNLQGSKCKLTCDAQYYPENQVCKACSLRVANCLECNTLTCTKCQSTYYLYNNTCPNTCPTGTYQDTSTSVAKCSACLNTSCATCEAAPSTKCLTCNSSQYKQGDTCVNTCDGNMYPNSQRVCTLCSSKFVGCNSCTIDKCNSCINPLQYLDKVNNSCGTTCPSGTFKETIVSPALNVCTACNSNCLTCDQISTQCTSCISTMYLQGDLCKSQCDTGYYPNTGRQCIICNSKFPFCNKCSPTQCQQCSLPYFFVEGQNTCQNTCPPGYVNSTSGIYNTCKQCTNSLCKTCLLGDLNKCDSCYPTSSKPYLSGNTCVASCGPNEYAISASKECRSCSLQFPNCSTCIQGTCTSCDSFLYLDVTTNTCVSNCGSLLPVTTPIYKCIQNCTALDPALTNCVKCITLAGGSNICQECTSITVLDSDLCYPYCPNGKYPDNQRICQECNLLFNGCSLCTSSTCSQCSTTGYYFDPVAQKCDSQCEYGANPVSPQILCQDCTDNSCKSCQTNDLNYCLTCDSTTNNKYLQDGDCVSTCSSQYYLDGDTCKLCPTKFSNCDTCDFDECYSCKSSFYLSIDKLNCFSTCPDKQYQAIINGIKMCQNCQNLRCQTCDETNPSKCLSCDQSQNTKYLENNQCNLQCSDQTYPDSNNICQLCDPHFLNCDSCTSSSCQSCKAGFVLDVPTNKCLNNCPQGKYATPSSQCEFCNQSSECAICNPLIPSQCTQCINSFYLQSGFCVLNCPEGTYPDSNRICQPCSSLSSHCIKCNPGYCTECEDGDIYLDQNSKKCVSQCPDGYFKSMDTSTGIKICKECLIDLCKECLVDGSCLSCYTTKPEQYLNGTKCDSTCPKYIDDLNKLCVSTCGTNETPDPITKICTLCTNKIYNEQCLVNCPVGTSPDSNPLNSNFCVLCSQLHSNCEECQTSQCTQCMNNYYLSSSGTCDLVCPPGTFKDSLIRKCVNSCSQPGYYADVSSGSCLQCNPDQCVECIDNSDKCTKCVPGKYLYESLYQCYSNCPSKTYNDSLSGKCLPCNQPTCLQCKTDVICHQCSDYLNQDDNLCYSNCPPGKYNYQNSCVSSCPKGSYLDYLSNNCKLCYEQCQECTSSTNCTVCISNHLNNSDISLPQICDQCDLGFTMIGNFCEKCSSNCLTCQNSPNECTSCQFGFNIDLNKTCIACLSNQYFDATLLLCQNCENGCLKCKDSNNPLDPSQCLQCNEQLEYFEINGHCIHCPLSDIQYFDKVSKKCIIIETGGAIPKLVVLSQITRDQDKILINAYITFDIPVKVVNQDWILNLDNVDNKGYQINFSVQKEEKQTSNNKSTMKNINNKSNGVNGGENYYIILIKIEIDSILSQTYKKLNVNFQNPKNVQDSKKFGLKMIYLNGDLPDYSEYIYPTTSTTAQITKGLATTSHLLLMLSTPFYLLVSFFDILQLTNYLLYLNVQYPSTLYNVIKLFEFANFELIPNVQNDHSSSPFKFRMEKIDTFIFSNLIQSIAIWSFSFVLYLVTKIVSRKFISSTNSIVQFCKSYHHNYFYQIIVGLGFLTYCDLLLSVFLQFYGSTSFTVLQAFGVVSSLVILVGIIRLNYLTFNSTQISINELAQDKKIQSLYGFHYNGIELNKKKALMNILFLFRKTIVIHQLVFNQDNPIKQIYICCLSVGIETTVMLILKPYRNNNEQKLHIFSRFLMISSMVMILILSINDAISNLSNDSKNTIQILVSIQLITIYITQVSYLVYKLYQILKRRYLIKNSAKLV